MTIYIHCPHCHKRLESVEQACPYCGAALPPGVLYALSAALGQTPMPAPHLASQRMPPHLAPGPARPAPEAMAGPPTPTAHSPLRPWLAAALSLVCGLGQLYNGQVAKGVLLLLAAAASVAAMVSWHSPVAFVIAPLLWLYGIVDAYLVARQG